MNLFNEPQASLSVVIVYVDHRYECEGECVFVSVCPLVNCL